MLILMILPSQISCWFALYFYVDPHIFPSSIICGHAYFSLINYMQIRINYMRICGSERDFLFVMVIKTRNYKCDMLPYIGSLTCYWVEVARRI